MSKHLILGLLVVVCIVCNTFLHLDFCILNKKLKLNIYIEITMRIEIPIENNFTIKKIYD